MEIAGQVSTQSHGVAVGVVDGTDRSSPSPPLGAQPYRNSTAVHRMVLYHAVAQRQVVQCNRVRTWSSLEPPPYRLTVRRQPRRGERDHVSETSEGRLCIPRRGCRRERLHQAAGMPGAARGRQYMVDPAQVAEGSLGITGRRNGSRRADPAERGIGGLNLQMPSGASVHHQDAASTSSTRTIADWRPVSAGRHPFAVHRVCSAEASVGIGQVLTGVTTARWQPTRRSAWLIRSQATHRVGGVIGEDSDLGWPCFGVDAHPRTAQSLLAAVT